MILWIYQLFIVYCLLSFTHVLDLPYIICAPVNNDTIWINNIQLMPSFYLKLLHNYIDCLHKNWKHAHLLHLQLCFYYAIQFDLIYYNVHKFKQIEYNYYDVLIIW